MNILLIARKSMCVGGIETNLYNLVKQFVEFGYRVIWLKPQGGVIDRAYDSMLTSNSIEIVNINPSKLFWYKKIILNISDHDHIVAFTSNMIEFCIIDKVKDHFDILNIDIFYWTPHYLGVGIFHEERFPKVLQKPLRAWLSKMYCKMDVNNNILYGNHRHMKAFSEHYQFNVHAEIDNKLFDGKVYTKSTPTFNKKDCLKRALRETVNIVAVGRVIFPHKGFILGLVDAFNIMHQRYPQLRLTIVGDGPDMNVLKVKISKCSIDAQNHITLTGIVPPDQLSQYFKDAHLNIGVAATVSAGALNGVISIPARSYSNSCEVYGYLPESKSKNLSDTPGLAVEDFILDLITMSKERFIELSENSYNTYSKTDKIAFATKLLNTSNIDRNKCLTSIYRAFFLWGYRIANIFTFVKHTRTN